MEGDLGYGEPIVTWTDSIIKGILTTAYYRYMQFVLDFLIAW